MSESAQEVATASYLKTMKDLVCCPVNTFTKSLNLGEDGIRRGSPNEWLRVAVRVLHVVVDFGNQFLHAAERSPANGSLRDAVEPDLHLVEPGGISRSEVDMESWPCGEPAPNSQVLVGGVIIHDDVHV